MGRSKLTVAVFTLLLVLAFWGCSKTDALSAIQVAPDKVTLLSGGLQPLSVNASYSSGAVKQVANWTGTSSDPAVAIVDADGYVKGVAAGSTNLTVAYKENGVSKTVTIPVQVEAAPKPPAVYYVSE